MTRITRLRRITLHFSHIGLTLGRTFIALILWGSEPNLWGSRARCARTRTDQHTQTAGVHQPFDVCFVDGKCHDCQPVDYILLNRIAGRDLLVAIRDTAPGEIIWSELNLNLVTRKNPDVMAPHLS